MEDLAFAPAAASCVQPTRTVRLGVVSALALAIALVLPANEVVHTDDLHLGSGRMAWVRRARSILADTTPFKAPIEELLLSFELVLGFRDLQLLLLHQFLETVFEFLLEGCFLFDTLCLPLLLFLLQVVDLLLQDFNVEFELLLDLDMVSNFRFVILQLGLVLFGRQVNRVEG